MAIPAGYSRLVIHGTQGADVFETGVWVHHAPSSQDDAQTMVNNAWNLFVADALQSLCNIIPPTSSYTGMRVYCYPDGGPKASYIAEAHATAQAGASQHLMPPQVAMVATTRTGAAGRRARGRLYLPAAGMGMEGAGLFDHNVIGATCTAIAGWLTALQGAGWTPVVLSGVGGASRDITQVTMDNKPDIQRRRANKLVATNTTSNTLG